MFEVNSVYNKINEFFIYTHNFTIKELNNVIIEMLFSYNALNYIFNGAEEKSGNYKKMLRRFIPAKFINSEKIWLSIWEKAEDEIKEMMNENYSFYSFYAEALMAYLNYIYLDNTLLCAVLNVNDTLTDQRTGGDSCMISDKYIVLGEAKFYQDFNNAKYMIKKDFESSSLYNKLDNLYRSYINSDFDIIIKTVDDKKINCTYEEFLKKNIILSGFILHDKKDSYKYDDIDEIKTLRKLKNSKIVFYHLPIESKNELILLIIKKALELIVDEPE